MIERIILISLICTGIHVCTWDGMIFQRFPKLYNDLVMKMRTYPPVGKILVFLRNPLYGCLRCMASIWTIAVWLCAGWNIDLSLVGAIIAVCGINTIVSSFIKKPIEYVEIP